MTLHEKVELLDVVEGGKSYAVVGCHYGVSESIMCYIKKNEKATRSSVASSYHYYVHIILHYYCFLFIIATYYYIITVLMSKTVCRMCFGSIF